MSRASALGAEMARAHRLITKPGVQNPHCDPLPAAIRSCHSFNWVLTLPIPSMVVMHDPSNVATGRRQELMDVCVTLFACGSKCESKTVHAPQPPSLHPILAPVKPTS